MGIFMGYQVHSGGRWPGDYLVMDAAMYAARAEDFAAHAHRVKEVIFDGDLSFPVRDGKLTALPTDPQESKRVLGDPEHNESLEETMWDLQPDEGTQLVDDDDRAYDRGGSSASSGGRKRRTRRDRATETRGVCRTRSKHRRLLGLETIYLSTSPQSTTAIYVCTGPLPRSTTYPT